MYGIRDDGDGVSDDACDYFTGYKEQSYGDYDDKSSIVAGVILLWRRSVEFVYISFPSLPIHRTSNLDNEMLAVVLICFKMGTFQFLSREGK